MSKPDPRPSLRRWRAPLLFSAALLVLTAVAPSAALAHPGEGGFILLLPTDIYIAAGVSVVALTLVVLAVLPGHAARAAFTPVLWQMLRPRWPVRVMRMISAALLVFLIWQGFAGTRDPLSNPLPLFVWTVFWVGLVAVQGLVGDVWRWINPWLGFAPLRGRGSRGMLRYPQWLACWPACLGFLLFSGFLLADIAPTDPTRLAWAVALYSVFTLAGMLVFGPIWILRAEAITVMMRVYSRIAPCGRRGPRAGLGLWGWRALVGAAPPLSLAVLMVLLLGTGSFDGLNETFWWIDIIGLNPLEFTGRSAAQWQNLTGLVLANLVLMAVFVSGLWAGARFSGDGRGLSLLFRIYAPSLLPIALGYHIAHYLTAFLVDGQYVLKVLDDPMGRGAHILGLQDFRVTLGMFNRQDSVRTIWLTQAGAVVLGHVVAILMAHATALKTTDSIRMAVLGQLPIALFMVAYTFLGLWLLATPRGA